MSVPAEERRRRWRLALGGDEPLREEPDIAMDRALAAIYDAPEKGAKRRGGLGGSAPRVARWLGDIRGFFPAPVVQVMQRDALDRLGLKQMLLQPELLAAITPDVHLVADLLSLHRLMPEAARATAREVVASVVAELRRRLEQLTVASVRAALRRGPRTRRPRPAEIDWHRTIRANLRHWQPERRQLAVESLVGRVRRSRRIDCDRLILCVDQSGSMAASVVYASVLGAVLASLPEIDTAMVCFDTAVLDLTDLLSDPVELLFGVQLGGGTDINRALAYCQELVREPARTHLVLLSDLYEGGDAEAMLARAAALVRGGVNLIVLLALSDEGQPSYDARHAAALAALGCPVFGCTPDQFPELMAAALARADIAAWAASRGIALVRG
ncbi:MAG: VWA domain-containing protein [Dongiaceae bacterium]